MALSIHLHLNFFIVHNMCSANFVVVPFPYFFLIPPNISLRNSTTVPLYFIGFPRLECQSPCKFRIHNVTIFTLHFTSLLHFYTLLFFLRWFISFTVARSITYLCFFMRGGGGNFGLLKFLRFRTWIIEHQTRVREYHCISSQNCYVPILWFVELRSWTIHLNRLICEWLTRKLGWHKCL